MQNEDYSQTIQELITAWKPFVDGLDDWQELVEGATPKQTYCGPIYEPISPLDRPNESFAIADMRGVKVAEPHYHANGETEVYFVVSGSGVTVDGGKEIPLSEGVVVVTPPNTAHFTIPKENLVMVVVNTPPFNPANNVRVEHSDPSVGFDEAQFLRLKGK
jgi:mannose-6-phosphate isomerase-like protein (cupin superfamily)